METQGYDPIPSHLLDDLSEDDLRELGEDQDEWNELAAEVESGGSPDTDQTPPDGDPDPGTDDDDIDAGLHEDIDDDQTPPDGDPDDGGDGSGEGEELQPSGQAPEWAEFFRSNGVAVDDHGLILGRYKTPEEYFKSDENRRSLLGKRAEHLLQDPDAVQEYVLGNPELVSRLRQLLGTGYPAPASAGYPPAQSQQLTFGQPAPAPQPAPVPGQAPGQYTQPGQMSIDQVVDTWVDQTVGRPADILIQRFGSVLAERGFRDDEGRPVLPANDAEWSDFAREDPHAYNLMWQTYQAVEQRRAEIRNEGYAALNEREQVVRSVPEIEREAVEYAAAELRNRYGLDDPNVVNEHMAALQSLAGFDPQRGQFVYDPMYYEVRGHVPVLRKDALLRYVEANDMDSLLEYRDRSRQAATADQRRQVMQGRAARVPATTVGAVHGASQGMSRERVDRGDLPTPEQWKSPAWMDAVIQKNGFDRLREIEEAINQLDESERKPYF